MMGCTETGGQADTDSEAESLTLTNKKSQKSRDNWEWVDFVT